MSECAIAPLRDDPLVDTNGMAALPAQIFFEQIQSCLADLQTRMTALEARVTALENP